MKMWFLGYDYYIGTLYIELINFSCIAANYHLQAAVTSITKVRSQYSSF